jgi:Protein of unknown function (DUF1360)
MSQRGMGTRGKGRSGSFDETEPEDTCSETPPQATAVPPGFRHIDGATSFIREPFVEGDPRDSEEEHPVQTGGMEQALGELVTCSRCVGTWAAAGLATTQVLAPRFGRMLTWALAGAAINDFLQAGFVALARKANAGEQDEAV